LKIAIYNLHFATLGGGERRTSALAAHLAKNHHVTLFVRSPASINTAKTFFGIDLANVEIISLEHKVHSAEIARRQFDLFINNSHGSNFPNPAHRGIYMCMYPEAERLDLSSYQIITANSEFTAEWIKKRWDYPSEVVYSACHDMGPPSAKENIILNVARFFADTETVHHKRQDTLLHLFKQLVDGGLRGWELHLVGMVGGTDQDRSFVESIRHDAAGYPVQIRPAIEFDELQTTYRKSSIYWHATGFGTSVLEHPSKQEHFGMSIVEAMSAGVVPVAFNAGGPRETINPGINGYLWNDLPELKALSLRLIENPASLQSMSTAAIGHSKAFDVVQFLARMDHLIETLAATRISWLAQAKSYIRRRHSQS
jgi:glycosyltransferase involved in cell wall biosynthesis